MLPLLRTTVLALLPFLCAVPCGWGREFPEDVTTHLEGGMASRQKSPGDVTSEYFTNAELEEYMQDFSERCNHVSRLFSIGESTRGRPLWVLEISDHPGLEEPKPNFKYVANMHGDEPAGRQLLLKLAEWLCSNYPEHPWARAIVGRMHLFLLPTMNPDGFASHQRHNGNDQDLNRNFPDRVEQKGDLNATGREQPETLAVMKWVQNGSFVGSADLHEGALVANYPWDGAEDHSHGVAAAPDDKVFVFLAKLYAAKHRLMHDSTEFKDGITNGNAWYPVYGGMQDWNYLVGNCFEITLEISPKKWPAGETLGQLWVDNLDAMLTYPLVASLGGASGRVQILNGKGQIQPVAAQIHVDGIDHDLFGKPRFGDYYRPLPPGTYNITATAEGYEASTATITVPESMAGAVHDFLLRSKDPQFHERPSKDIVEGFAPPNGAFGWSTAPNFQQRGGMPGFGSYFLLFAFAAIAAVGLVYANRTRQTNARPN